MSQLRNPPFLGLLEPDPPRRDPLDPEPTREFAALLLIHHMIATATAPTVAPVVNASPIVFDDERPRIVEEAREGAYGIEDILSATLSALLRFRGFKGKLSSRVNSNSDDRVEEIGEFSPLDRNRHGHSDLQFATVGVRLHFVPL